MGGSALGRQGAGTTAPAIGRVFGKGSSIDSASCAGIKSVKSLSF